MSTDNNLPHDGNHKQLKKASVGLISLVGMYFAEICSGAFGIEEMIPAAGPGMTLVMLVLLAVVWATPLCFICAELGSARPGEGGVLIWVKEALGEFWYVVALFGMLILGPLAEAVYAVLCVSYLGELVPLTPMVANLLKLVIVVFFFLLNVKGVREVGIFSTVLTLAIVAAFAAVAIVGLTNWHQSPVTPFVADPESGIFASMGAGLSVGIYMYCGFEQISMMSGEIQDAPRLIPKALMISIPIISLTYILPTLAGLVSVGPWQDWTTEPGGLGYASVLTENGIPAGGVLFLVVAVIAQLAAYNVSLGSAARAVYMLAEENFAPKWVAGISKRFGTPKNALLVTTLIIVVLIPFDFTFLVTLEVFSVVLIYGLMAISAMILKKRIPEKEFLFKFPGGKLFHTICCLMILVICVMVTVVSGVDYFCGGLSAALAFPVLYVICKRAFKGCTVKEAALYPINPKTGLGFGDLRKIACYYVGVGIYCILTKFFLVWYEGGIEAGSAYYLETYQTGIFSNMPLMLNIILLVGVCSMVGGLLLLALAKKVDRTPSKR